MVKELLASLESIVDATCKERSSSEACRETFDGGESTRFTYNQLQIESLKIARGILSKVSFTNDKSAGLDVRPIGVCMRRGFDWYCVYIALIRLGIPVVPMVQDISDEGAQLSRNEDIVSSLTPCLVVFDSRAPQSAADLCERKGVPIVSVNALKSRENADLPIRPLFAVDRTPLAYLYTGGTTRASKCAVISHQMAMHEMEGYRIVAPQISHQDRVIQHSSSYWGATFLGQINIALAFGASVVFCNNSTDLTPVIERENISVLGLVPSQLSAISGPCPSVRTVFTWGEKLPHSVANKWKSKCSLIELLVSTEYWLSLYALNGEDTFRVLPSVTFRIESGELLIGGACVTPWGYTKRALNDKIFVTLEGTRFFRSNDLVQFTKDNQLRFMGRSDSMVKIGGEWKDLFVLQENLLDIEGIADACVLDSGRITAFIVLKSGPVSQNTINSVRAIINEAYIHVRYVSRLPRNEITGKIDRSVLKLRNFSSTSQKSKTRVKRVIVQWFLWALVVHLSLLVVGWGSVYPLLIAPYVALSEMTSDRPSVRAQKFYKIGLWSQITLGLAVLVLVVCQWHYQLIETRVILGITGVASVVGLGHLVPAPPGGVVTSSIITSGFVGMFSSLIPFSQSRTILMSLVLVYYLRTSKVRSIRHALSWFVTYWICVPRQLERTEWKRTSPINTRKRMGNPQTFSEKGEKIWTNKSLFETNLFTYSVISVSETEASDLGKCLKMHQHVSRCISMNSGSSSVVCDMTRPVSAITEMVCQDLPKPVDEKTLLTGLNSLAAVELTNHLRDFTGRDVHVADILGCVTVGDLAQKIERSKFIEKISTDAEKSEYRCQLWGWGFPCAWVFEFENSWLHYRSLQSAISGLCKRHPALLTTCIDSKALSYWMNECLVVVGLLRHLSPPWFGWLVAGIGRCVFESWNRVSSRQDRELRIGWKKFQTESEFREYLLEKKRKPNFYAPTEVDVVVLSSGGRDRYFVRLYVTHAFSDGSCVVPILKDLTELYNAAVDQREPNLGPVPPNAFQIQENRLRHSLTDPITADPRKDSFYLCYNMDMDDSKDLCSFGRIVILDESFVLVAQAAARSLAVPIDVLFLSAIAASLARLWNWADLVQLALVVPLRDGPHEAEVVGFLADQRNIDIPLIGRNLTSLATVVQVVHALRRTRGWETPSPFTNCERTLVNIVQANFPEDARFRQELVIQQHEAAMGMLYRPMELYVEQLQPYMWSLKARCRLREYSPEKFERFCGIFKQVVIEMLQSPNKPLLQ